jgi:enoyl-CoA hydratase/carnithine racemase
MFRKSDNVTTNLEGSTAILTLIKPDKRNALSQEMMIELIHCLDAVANTPAVRTVIIAAEGKVFCSGHDLRELSGREECDYREIFEICTKLMLSIQSLPLPVIAEVQGLATAAGCQLVAACDLAVASTDAAFATPGVRIGLFCTTPMVPLVRSIGRKRAMQMLLTGQPIDSRTALEWGLVNRVVAPDELSAATRELASTIADASRETVAIGKRAFYEQIGIDERSAYALAKETMTLNALAEDAQEGFAAFLSKRAPVWRS